MPLLRSTIAVWLLVAFGACYTPPIFAAYRAHGQGCCTGHACCRKNSARHAGGGGSFFAASPACGQTCRLPAGVAAHETPAPAPRAVALDVTAISETLLPRPVARGGVSYFAFLYQRPPPSRS
jgi:hypothetical protein